MTCGHAAEGSLRPAHRPNILRAWNLTATPDLRARWDRERTFHDDLALTLDPAKLPAQEPVIYDTAVLREAGIGPESRVLDLGCGQGDLTRALLASGATVTSLDLSPGMVEIARRRVELYCQGRQARFIVARSSEPVYRPRASTWW